MKYETINNLTVEDMRLLDKIFGFVGLIRFKGEPVGININGGRLQLVVDHEVELEEYVPDIFLAKVAEYYRKVEFI